VPRNFFFDPNLCFAESLRPLFLRRTSLFPLPARFPSRRPFSSSKFRPGLAFEDFSGLDLPSGLFFSPASYSEALSFLGWPHSDFFWGSFSDLVTPFGFAGHFLGVPFSVWRSLPLLHFFSFKDFFRLDFFSSPRRSSPRFESFLGCLSHGTFFLSFHPFLGFLFLTVTIGVLPGGSVFGSSLRGGSLLLCFMMVSDSIAVPFLSIFASVAL